MTDWHSALVDTIASTETPKMPGCHQYTVFSDARRGNAKTRLESYPLKTA